MTYDQVVAAWNAQADEHNQWDSLGEDEKIEWALKCADQFRDATKMMDDDVASISLRQRADAWMQVCALLHELRPGWIDTSTGTAAQHALNAIRSMGGSEGYYEQEK